MCPTCFNSQHFGSSAAHRIQGALGNGIWGPLLQNTCNNLLNVNKY
jgi:hypothetical protein